MAAVRLHYNLYRSIGLALAVLLLTACAAQAPEPGRTDEPVLVWPAAPQTPRIRYLYSVTKPQDILAGKGWARKAWDFVRGRRERNIGSPYGVAVDGEGRLYVVDTFYRAVHVFDTVRNKHYLFPEEPIEGFVSPLDIALGSGGRIYVSDSGSNRVHVFTGQGRKYLQSIGEDRIERPTGLVVNAGTGELLVLDTTASRLLVYDETSLAFKRTVGEESEAEGGFHYPTNLAAANDGSVYVSDSLNFRVQAFDAGLSFRMAFGTAGDGPGHFSRPKGIAVDSEGHVYVVDALFDNVQIFDSEGRLLLAFGSAGGGRGEFWLPNALFIDHRDRIYVSDSHNHRVQVFQYLKEGMQEP